MTTAALQVEALQKQLQVSQAPTVPAAQMNNRPAKGSGLSCMPADAQIRHHPVRRRCGNVAPAAGAEPVRRLHLAIAADGFNFRSQARAAEADAPLTGAKLGNFSGACQDDFAQALAFPFGLASGAPPVACNFSDARLFGPQPRVAPSHHLSQGAASSTPACMRQGSSACHVPQART